MSSTAAAAPRTSEKSGELRRAVLEVLRDLLAGGRNDDVIALVTALVSRNHELELLLARLRNSQNRGEDVSRAQLDLFLEELHKSSD
jgi:hypothetical protein